MTILAVAVVLAAAVAGLYAFHKPRNYSATTTVFVGRVVPDNAGSNVSTAVADFATAMKLPTTLQGVSQQTGVSVSGLRKGLKESQVTSSSAVSVSYTSPIPSTAGKVVTSTARVALVALATQQVDAAQDQVRAADTNVTAASASIENFDTRLGVTDFGTQYETAQQNLLNLQDALATANSSTRYAIESELSTQSAYVAKLNAADPQWQILNSELTQAQSALQVANEALTTAQGNAIAASSPTVLTPAQVVQQSRISPALRLAVMAAVVMAALGLALIVGGETLVRRRELAGEPSVDRVPERHPEPVRRPELPVRPEPEPVSAEAARTSSSVSRVMWLETSVSEGASSSIDWARPKALEEAHHPRHTDTPGGDRSPNALPVRRVNGGGDLIAAVERIEQQIQRMGGSIDELLKSYSRPQPTIDDPFGLWSDEQGRDRSEPSDR